MKTADQTFVKTFNKSRVLLTVKNRSPISRAQISEITGLNKATVSSLISELIKEKFVFEIGNGQSSGGRRPVMLTFNHRAGYAIGVDVGVNYLLAVATDLNGNCLEEEKQPIADTNVEKVLPHVIQLIRKLIKKAPQSEYGLIGIGIGVPGIVNRQQTILFAPNLGWENVHLRREIESTFDVPVLLDNEANAGAWGEKLYGAGRNIADLIYVSVGIGIGTGIIMNDEVYKGTNGFSGEMGHFSIDLNGRTCRCGNRGCWERYASEKALLESARKRHLFQEESGRDELAAIAEMAEAGDTRVQQLLYEIGEYLGIGITNIVNTFNPRLVIIGNRMSTLKKWLAQPIERVLEERLMPYNRQNVEVRFSELTNHSCALGAASFAISHFFSEKQYDLL